ncbi:hypothetical protein DM01DRAFT_1408654 [Hesseltinella vesiculosa]|uniref:Uncharacterized protein n=1 Tax=Hesseltinella vesiculosa TaxID=101127 RepID=A0A1X2GE79_9FUNG|nr:hypothetical protein DM01DRAFT_1408654 [Hesseltinella vesiculosa]
MATTDDPHCPPPLISEPHSFQDQFIHLLKEITKLQWVRESLPVQSKYYEGMKQRYARESHLKALLEKQLQDFRKKQDASSLAMLRRNSNDKNESSYADLIDRLRRCEAKLEDVETQMQSASTMLQDLHANKHKLDVLCMELHMLYDQIIADSQDDGSQIVERHLKQEVIQFAADIPRIQAEIDSHTKAQRKLYQARERMETAMMSLPGASTFLDRQALASHRSPSHLFGKSGVLTAVVDVTVPSLKDAERLASEAYGLVEEASKLCPDVPVIPSSNFSRDDNVMNILTAYRGYRLKIETILRTQLNPRLSKLQSQLAMTKYHYEQKTIEWIDQQITILETLLRQNGCLENVNLDQEISVLRMGSNAAMAAVSAETSSGRITVDDALEVLQSPTHVERNGYLPQYSADDTATPSSSTSILTGLHQPLPDYSPQQESDDPPGYI